jgi:hypothetical protein
VLLTTRIIHTPQYHPQGVFYNLLLTVRPWLAAAEFMPENGDDDFTQCVQLGLFTTEAELQRADPVAIRHLPHVQQRGAEAAAMLHALDSGRSSSSDSGGHRRCGCAFGGFRLLDAPDDAMTQQQ